ncbi:GlcG/HbpS family heme-binding protein [Streptosporangium sp. V21-05]|uniref:GlcG/HbpS family heme-binding protein n=1 Tax=Streptosporangium sp. V21-05 TaxID=3446115 RepID=UPI003F53986D
MTEDLRTGLTPSLELARRLAAGAESEALRQGKPMGIAVVDRGGQVLLAVRMDGAGPVALQLAIDKAFTAAAFDARTDAWGEVTRPGGADWGLTSALGGRVVILAGGLPLRAGGQLVGGIGVSGAAPPVDLACAVAGLRAGLGPLDEIEGLVTLQPTN